MPESPEKDPVVGQSLAGYIVISALLLILSLGWALYDEFIGLRPWKTYQQRFAALYLRYLDRQIPKQRAAEKAIRESAEFRVLEEKLKDLEASVAPQVKELDQRAALIDERMAAITLEYTDRRADVASRIYEVDHTSSPSAKERIRTKLIKFQQGPFVVEAVNLATGKVERLKLTYQQLEDEFRNLQAQKAQLTAQKAALLAEVTELKRKRDSYVQEYLVGLTEDQLAGLRNKVLASGVEIRQINNPDAGLVDRCESCHLSIREPVVLTAADMGGKKDPMARAFTSHPDLELLKIHDPEKFGCSPCHNGNGMQVQSVEHAHGQYEHWLWPLYPMENVEAGCQQCHARDMLVDHAPVLSAGKELFQWQGCVGCHRFEGYDPEPEEMIAVQQSIQQLEEQKAAYRRIIDRSDEDAAKAPTNEEARKIYERADKLRVSISDIDTQIEQLDYRAKNLLREVKKVGPDLKEVRVKLRPEWIPAWIKDPHAFRPTTRMPRFRLSEGEVKAVAAFIWQSAIDAKLSAQPRGDPVRGKESFETRGCMGCHSVGEGPNRVGGTFGANLSRVGEKVSYDYLVRWVHNPRERTRPYCTYEKRDLTEQDYRKHGLPFVFDLDHTTCPNDGHELQVEQMTAMPNLRLSWQEARDVASYLITLKKPDAAPFPGAPHLSDSKLKAEGKALAQQHGCAGCHEIAGLENEGRIGTELTKEGSKPLEQFDFALFVRQAREEAWYSHKGFFEHKLAKPGMFDEGMTKAPGEKLRMPNLFEPVSSKVKEGVPELSSQDQEQIRALATFLMGSVDSQLPRRYFHLPEDYRRDIQDGWWIVKKYNCMGCHQFMVGQTPSLTEIPRYQTPEGKDQLPPKLMGEGARANPDWLLKFLTNPAMSPMDTDRNGVRPYLKARMPTFYFSPGEVRKLVRFFQALSSQPLPYIAPRLDPLTLEEVAMARALFTSRAAPCLKCHATGEPAHDRTATAPNFLLAPERLKPGWTRRWILDPAMISPGTAMPSGLFKQDGERWVFSGPTPPLFKGYVKDHADLLVRYMFEITPEEQRRLVGMSASSLRQASTERDGKNAPGSRAALVGAPLKSH